MSSRVARLHQHALVRPANRGRNAGAGTLRRVLDFPRIFSRLPAPKCLRKWLGYLDQFVIFPLMLRKRARALLAESVFVVADQALGMWVPSICRYSHVIHCHDFLAQRSALGEFPENPTGGPHLPGAHSPGLSAGAGFCLGLKETHEDLHRFLTRPFVQSSVIYNPLNNPFFPLLREEALSRLETWRSDLDPGYLLHVGGDQWYKNRPGVVAIYRAYCERTRDPVTMVMIGTPPSARLLNDASSCAHGGKVIFLFGLKRRPNSRCLCSGYSTPISFAGGRVRLADCRGDGLWLPCYYYGSGSNE